MTKEEMLIIIEILKTRLQFRELNGNQKYGYGLALEEIEKEVKPQLKPQEGDELLQALKTITNKQKQWKN